MSLTPPTAPAGILPGSAVPGDFLPINSAGGVTTAGSFGGHILAIDPGATGALAWLSVTGDLIAVEDMPSMQIKVGTKMRTRVSAAVLASIIRQRMPSAAYVEKVGAMPGQGTASMFAFGYSAGMVEGVLAGLAIPVTYITPQAWKKISGLTADKAAARMRAAQLWPAHAKTFARVKDDGRAEAALIAYAARMMAAIEMAKTERVAA